MQADLDVQSIPIADVFIVGKRRPVDEAAVDNLVGSIDKIGLQQPITVRVSDVNDPEEGEILGAFALVAGAHRLAACKRLGWKAIPAVVTGWTEVDARLWEISENLHRAELSAVERAEQIDEWRRLTVERSFANNLQNPVPGRPSKGFTETAKTLGVSHTTVQNAEKIAALPQETRDKAREEGWSQSKLLDAARPAPKPPKVAADPLNGPLALEKQVARLMDAWNAAAPDARAEFLARIDTPVMDARFG